MLRSTASVLLVVGVIATAIAFGMHAFTSSKLESMAMIRGDRPGATVVERTITDVSRTSLQRNRAVCWVYFDEPSPPRSDGRLNLQCDQFASLAVGQTIPVVYLPDDEHAYLRDGIYASPGNVQFDEMLMWVWRLGLAAGLLLLAGAAVTFVRGRLRAR